MAKKALALLLVALLILTLTACGAGGGSSSEGGGAAEEKAEEAEMEEEAPTLGETMKDTAREEQISRQKSLTVGETGTAGGVSVTLNKVYLTEGDEYALEALKPGDIYMVCELTVTNGSDKDIQPYDFNASLYANSQACESAYTNVSLYGLSALAPGTNGTGEISFEVPQDSNTFELRIMPYWFEATEKDELVFSFDTTQIS